MALTSEDWQNRQGDDDGTEMGIIRIKTVDRKANIDGGVWTRKSGRDDKLSWKQCSVVSLCMSAIYGAIDDDQLMRFCCRGKEEKDRYKQRGRLAVSMIVVEYSEYRRDCDWWRVLHECTCIQLYVGQAGAIRLWHGMGELWRAVFGAHSM